MQTKDKFISLFLMGDYNINLLNHEIHADTGDFLNLLYANTMLPMITRLTRYGEFSATLIDNIITNEYSGTSLAGILLLLLLLLLLDRLIMRAMS